MSRNLLFALDPKTEAVLVSASPKGSKQIHFIERIAREENEILYNAVVTLTSITQAPDIDVKLFKATDKLCQQIYANHAD